MFHVAGSGERAILSSAKTSAAALVFGLAIAMVAGPSAIAQTATPQTPTQQTPTEQAPTQTPKPAAAQPPAPPKDATPAEVLDDKDVETVLGREIYSIAGEDMGRIVDVLVDHKGNIRAAIIDFGGFLGVGSRKLAVDWRAIQFSPDRAILSLTRDQVRVAPEYKDGEPVVVLGPGSPAAAKPPHTQQTQQNAKPAATAPAK
jgi:sporulation protein YlmC with PRC-barrel domain